jgi:transposase
MDHSRVEWEQRKKENTAMALTLPDARQLSDEVLEALRLRALYGYERGFAQADIADLLGVSRETVSRWWTAYADGGLDAIPHDRTGRPVGSGRSLSDDQARDIQQQIDDHSPEELGISAALWTRKAVRDLIRQTTGIDMPVRTVGEYLKRWGSTAKVPRRHAKDQDPEEVRTWLEVTYPAIEERATHEDAEIHWCDETGATADEQPHKGYAHRGQPAPLEVPKPHIRMNQVSTITNEGVVHFMTYKETMTAARFITFLEGLLSETTKKVFLIVDRLRAHEAKAVEEWVAEHRDRIELFFLPRYAPELNADEYLNNDLKGSINQDGLPGGQGELRSRMERFMSELLHLPEHVRNYFRHPCVQYAAGV